MNAPIANEKDVPGASLKTEEGWRASKLNLTQYLQVGASVDESIADACPLASLTVSQRVGRQEEADQQTDTVSSCSRPGDRASASNAETSSLDALPPCGNCQKVAV